MARWRRRIIALTIFVTSGFVVSQLEPGRRAKAADDENADKPEYGVPHPDCTFFTERREKFLRGDQLLQPSGSNSLSALTDQVASALPNGRMAPARSRSGSLRETASDSYIDNHIFTVLKRLGIPPAELTTDQEFLRRVTLDLTGRIPTPDELVQFLADSSPDKRAQAIDRLLASGAWADKWAMFFGDLYRVSIANQHFNRYQQGRDAYYYYIVDSLRANKSYQDMARELISNGGNTWDVGQANFTLQGRITGGPDQDTYDGMAVNVGAMLLGISHLDCILCHDGAGHLDTLSLWGSQAKRENAWGMAAFFSRTRLAIAAGNNARPWSVGEVGTGFYNLNTTTGNRPARRAINGKTTVTPRYIFGNGGEPAPDENWRDAMARLVTNDFQFARATVNYIWREFMTIGLVEPVDQFDPLRLNPNSPPPAPWTLQPSNPYLLDALAKSFVESNYDLRALMRDITNSRAYQLSSRYNGTWQPEWEKYYARKLVRRLMAEEVHDAVALSSGLLGGYTIAGFREPRIDFAMQLPDVVGVPGGVGGQFLDSFLRGNRNDDDRRSDLTILEALNLMNSAFVYNRTRNVAGSLLARVITLPNDQLVEQLYLNILSRFPTQAERDAGVAALSSGNRNNKAEDVAWSLYNKVDFVFNY